MAAQGDRAGRRTGDGTVNGVVPLMLSMAPAGPPLRVTPLPFRINNWYRVRLLVPPWSCKVAPEATPTVAGANPTTVVVTLAVAGLGWVGTVSAGSLSLPIGFGR